MSFCGRAVPALLQDTANGRERQASVGKCTECKVQKLRVTTSAGLALFPLSSPKFQEAPTSSSALCLPGLNSHCPETPSACTAHLALGCSGRSQPATGPSQPQVPASRLCTLHGRSPDHSVQRGPHGSHLLVKERAEGYPNARETPLHRSVGSSHFPCETRSVPCGWNSPERLCSLSYVRFYFRNNN